jgi:1A family penicillin-binding protein
MPIPGLKTNQSWRNGQKKHFLPLKNKRAGVLNLHAERKPKISDYTKRREGGNGIWKSIKRKVLIATAIIAVGGILFAAGAVIWISHDLPEPGKLADRTIAQTTKIYDRTGQTVLYEIHGDQQRTIVNLADLPPYVKNATIAIEDKNFYKHGAISIWGIFRGVIWRKLRGLPAQGGSTLTQQFVKNAILSDERTVQRKIKEWLLSYRLEEKYTKDEILQMYFNEIPYGSTAYGVEAAAQKYFGKSAKDITLSEAAVLAALPQAPSKYSPYGPNKGLLMGRRDYILDLMAEQGYISKEDADIAKAQEIKFQPQMANIKAPHFVMYIKDILSEKYGEKMVEQGGLKIITTLDLYKQNIAEEAIKAQADKNEKNYGATNAALVSIDPKNGEILAMVGSKDYFSTDIDGQVNIVTSLRQPGSSMKPLVYATSFIKGYTPNTILYDVVTNFSTDPSKPYEPHDYDLKERGPVTIRQALAGSLNIPAVKAIYLAGINNVLDLAEQFGYTTFADRSRFGLSLVLGGGEVKMIEHVNAFGAFAREGVLQPTVGVLKVEDKDGKTLEEFQPQEGKKVLDANIAREVNSILTDNSARTYIFGANNWLTLPNRPVAAKTGTTNDYHDAWTIGFTPSIVTGVWVGNNDNTVMKKGADGAVVAAPIWHSYMEKVLGDTPVEQFKAPIIPATGKAILDGKIGEPNIVKIDKSTGKLATDLTPASQIEEKSYFEPHSILFYIDKNDPLGPAPDKPENDPQFILWESRVIAWAAKQASSSTSTKFSADKPPVEYDDVHTAENKPEIRLISPSSNQTILDPTLIAQVSASANRGINRVEYYINDNLFFVNYDYPYSLSKPIDFLSNGFHNIKAIACDDVDNCASAQVEFNLILENNNNLNDTSEINLETPQNGLALSNVDFPANIVFKLSNYKAVAKINVYATNDGEATPKLLGVIGPIGNDGVIFKWAEVPPSGTYKLYGEAVTWSKKIIKGNANTLTINNLNSQATSTKPSL